MPQSKVRKTASERRLDAQVGSVNKLHAGYPSTHRRIPQTISKFVVNALEEHERLGPKSTPLTSAERSARDEAQAMFDRMPRRK
jgi:hypothetical protein